MKVIQNCKELLLEVLKWIVLSVIMSIPIGIIVGYFNIILSSANSFRKEHEFMVYFLPIAGIIISYMYVKAGRNAYSGENLLKSEVQKAAKDIPLYMIPVTFIGSLLTTLFGGSAGKEGSGIAMGGTLGDYLARKFELEEGEQRTLVLSGVGASYGVLYNVPFAGAILGMELVLKGEFHYNALIPAFLTSVISNEISQLIGNKAIEYPKLQLGDFNFTLILKLICLGILFGLIGMLFNYILDNSSKVYNHFFKSPIIKAIVGGVLTIALFYIAGDNFNGLGQSYINESFEYRVNGTDFLWKIIFTAVALGSVFQGGRGNPTFFVGATFGSFIADFFYLPIESVAALGMVGVFCASTSLPITSIALAMEYFGREEVMSIILIMVICYVVSGFYDILTKRELTKGKSTIFKAKVKVNTKK